MSLPTIHATQPKKIHEFYDRLVTNIQSLETMGKIREINGYVRLTLDKLPGIRADLVRIDDDWQEWGFPQMTEALRKWCERNPVPPSDQGLEYASGERGQHRPPRRECSKLSNKMGNTDLASTVTQAITNLLTARR